MQQLEFSRHSPSEAGVNGGAMPAPPALAEYWGAEELAATLDSVGAGVWAIDLEGRCVFINQAACRILGYSRGECLGRRLQCSVHRGPADGWRCPKEKCPIQRTLESGSAECVDDELFQRCDGISFPVQFSVQPVVVHGRMRGAVVSLADITSQKRTEEARRKSDEWLSFAQNAAGVGILDLDLKTRQVIASVGQFRLFGLDPAGEMPSFEEWLMMVHPEDRERMERRIEATLSGAEPAPEEYRVVWPDGSIHWLFTQPAAFFDEAGRATRLLGANVDITRRARAETALDQFFAAAPTPLAIWTLDGRIQRANQSWEPILGFRAAELEGLLVFDLVHPEESATAAAAFERVLVSGKVTGFECRVRCKDGSYRWLLVNAGVLKDAQVIYATAHDITERKRAEEALRESEEKFRELFDCAPVAYHELDMDGVVRRVNRAECALLGYELGEMLSRPIWDFIAGAEREASQEAIRRKLSEEQHLKPFQRRYIRRDGRELWIEIHDSLVRNAAGEATGIRTALLDVTERNQAEEALRESEEKFRELFDSAPVAYHELDRDGVVRRVNRAECALLGYEASDMLGRPVWEFIFQPDREGGRERIRRKLSGEQHLEPFQCPFVRRDGSELWVEIHDILVRNAAGESVGIRSALLDITERRRAEAALADEALRRRLVFEQSRDGIVIYDRSGKVRESNRSFANLLGYSLEEMLRLHVWDWDAQLTRDQILEMIGDGKSPPPIFETRQKRKDGSLFDAEISSISAELRGDVFYYALVRDITERKRMVQALELHAEKLAQSNAELERFAYVASHDLQEPLRMVASFTQLLSQRYSGKLDETADRYINFAVDGAKRMQQLISDLLAYSRVNSKELDLRRTECEAVVQATLQNLSAAIQESGAAIECDPLPVLTADAAQLGQLFQNLIGNAIKFRGQAPPRVHIAATDTGPDWLFSVQDNGIGIDPRHSGRIFEIFRRLHTRQECPGTGIGLAVCQKVAERHGGKIWVESEPGLGSTFRFTIRKREWMEREATGEQPRIVGAEPVLT